MIDTKLLYLSGVGPKGSESSIGNRLYFKINNPAVGQSFSDHIGIQLSIHYQGSPNFNYNDRASNNPNIIKYLNERTGPFTQYLPVLFAHFKSNPNLSRPNIEIMISPSGVGGYDRNVNSANKFQVLLIHMSQKGKTRLTLDENNSVKYPSVYFTNQDDLNDMVDALYIFLNDILPKNPQLSVHFGPGGYSHSNLNPKSKSDCRAYITGGEEKYGVTYSKMIMNHFTGTVPLLEDASLGGVDPQSLLVRGTSNVHVVDASIYPGTLSAHPVATIMAGAERASDLLINVIADPSIDTTSAPSTTSTTKAPSDAAKSPTTAPETPTATASKSPVDAPTTSADALSPSSDGIVQTTTAPAVDNNNKPVPSTTDSFKADRIVTSSASIHTYLLLGLALIIGAIAVLV
ncbi:hypothetical protein AKO1_003305 [Acrasis kona]|uniref:Glucose-methanol-choline oxidoreductase C-terminal domain-containing protein n=1 Tax=Acrasis kona TaxID=1008807 RepID=A0AAW2Z8F6_9EUKA